MSGNDDLIVFVCQKVQNLDPPPGTKPKNKHRNSKKGREHTFKEKMAIFEEKTDEKPGKSGQ